MKRFLAFFLALSASVAGAHGAAPPFSVGEEDGSPAMTVLGPLKVPNGSLSFSSGFWHLTFPAATNTAAGGTEGQLQMNIGGVLAGVPGISNYPVVNPNIYRSTFGGSWLVDYGYNQTATGLISSQDYSAFPNLAKDTNGWLHLFFTIGDIHGVSTNRSTAHRTSTNNGASFNSRALFTGLTLDATHDYREIAGVFDATNRALVTYTRRGPDLGATAYDDVEGFAMLSTDGLATFGTPLSLGNYRQGTGKPLWLRSGKGGAFYYQITNVSPQNYWPLYISIDNGVTAATAYSMSNSFIGTGYTRFSEVAGIEDPNTNDTIHAISRYESLVTGNDPDKNKLWYFLSTDGGTNWNGAVEIAGNYSLTPGRVQLAVSDDGRIFAAHDRARQLGDIPIYEFDPATISLRQIASVQTLGGTNSGYYVTIEYLDDDVLGVAYYREGGSTTEAEIYYTRVAVGSSIRNASLTAAKLQDNAVTTAKIAAGAVGTSDIAASVALTTPNIGAATGTSLALSGVASATTLDTGQGANELYDMDQNVLTTSSPTFAGVTSTAGFVGDGSNLTDLNASAASTGTLPGARVDPAYNYNFTGTVGFEDSNTAVDLHGSAAVGATETIDVSAAGHHVIILDENCTLTWTGWPASGRSRTIQLEVIQDSSGGNTLTSTETGALSISTTADAVTTLMIQSRDGGTTVTVFTSSTGSGAPSDAAYLVGTANGSLSAEIVVGTSPGGELGGTWASPTLDDGVTVDNWVLGSGSTATSPAATDNDTSLATTAYVKSAIGYTRIDAGAFIANTTSGAAATTTRLATLDAMEDSFDFDQSTDEFINVWFTLPAFYAGGDIAVAVIWTAASGTGDVVWSCGLRSFANDDPRDTATTFDDSVTDTLIATNDEHVTTLMTNVTIQGTPAAGERCVLKISRDANNGSDTLNADAKFLGVSITY